MCENAMQQIVKNNNNNKLIALKLSKLLQQVSQHNMMDCFQL